MPLPWISTWWIILGDGEYSNARIIRCARGRGELWERESLQDIPQYAPTRRSKLILIGRRAD